MDEVKNLLPSAKNILIVLPVGADTDKLAAGLSLYLALSLSKGHNQDKQVTIVCEDSIKVGQSHLFAIDKVTSSLLQTGSSNFTLSLEGVELVDSRPVALQNLDWYTQGQNILNLVFHVVPGKTFHPTKITPVYQARYDLIFVIGGANLNSLGNLYTQNQDVFTNVHIVNIDNQGNTGFGTTNILDNNAASVCEMAASLMSTLNLNIDADIATNLIFGIYQATNNLTSAKVNPDTFVAVANLLRLGGKKPGEISAQQPPVGLDLSGFIHQQPVVAVPIQAGSPEERPAGEGVITETPEPDWLTPKVFKGTSLG